MTARNGAGEGARHAWLWLVALVASVGGAAHAAPSFTVVAKSGDVLPGLPSAASTFGTWVISPGGRAMFAANTAAYEPALYRWRRGLAPELVAVVGEAVTGSTTGLKVPTTQYYFHSYQGDEQGDAFFWQDGYYRVTPGADVIFADATVPCPDPSDGKIGDFPFKGYTAYSSAGQVAFITCGGDVFTGATSPPTRVYDHRAPPGFMSGYTGGGDHVRVNRFGDVYFLAQQLYCDTSVNMACDGQPPASALYRVRGGVTTVVVDLSKVTIPGAAAPGLYPESLSVSNRAGLVMNAWWEDPDPTVYRRYGVVHFSEAGTMTVLAQQGGPAYLARSTFTGFGGTSLTGPPLALDDGGVLFAGTVESGPPVLYRQRPGELPELLLREGTALTGLPNVTLAGQPSLAVGPRGRIAFYGYVSEPTLGTHQALFVEKPNKDFELVLHEGQVLDLGLGKPFRASSVLMPTTWSAAGDGVNGSYMTERDEFLISLYDYDQTPSLSVLLHVGSGLVVNSLGDAPQGSGVGDACDTGALTATGDRECTLRAAIQAANLRSGEQRITFDLPSAGPIVVKTALPTALVPLVIDGPADRLVEVQAMGVPSGYGLEAEEHLLTARNLALRGFPQGGVSTQSPKGVELYGCEITGSGGFGVGSPKGTVKLAATPRGRTVIKANRDVGVFASRGQSAPNDGDPTIDLSEVDIDANEGAGVVSDGLVRLDRVNIRDNHGPGVVVADGPAISPTVAIGTGDAVSAWKNVVSGNHGDGLRAERGAISLSQSTEVRLNHGVGVRAKGAVWIGDTRPSPVPSANVIADNGGGASCSTYELLSGLPAGSAAPCGGGGVLSALASDDTVNYITFAKINDNRGPGVLVGGGTTLRGVEVRRNRGPGVAAGAVNDTLRTAHVSLELASFDPNVIAENQGNGLQTSSGNVNVYSTSIIEKNHGWGIYTDGVAWVAELSLTANLKSPTVIAGNGFGGVCDSYEIVDLEPKATPFPCTGGGVFSSFERESRRNYLVQVDVRGNAGPGVLVGTWIDLGVVNIEDNGGPGVVRAVDDTLLAKTAISFRVHLNRIARNGGAGLKTEYGDIVLDLPVEIVGNAGAGVEADQDVRMDVINDGTTGRVRVADNGRGDCQVWGIAQFRPVRRQEECVRSGVHALEKITGHHFDVVGNAGDGLHAETSVDIHDATVCGNGGMQIASPKIAATAVDQSCGLPGQMGGQGGEGPKAGGGCSLAPASSPFPSWPLAALALAVLRLVRRRRPGAPGVPRGVRGARGSRG